MISPELANIAIFSSLLITVVAYVVVSRRDGSYLNVLIPSLITGIPACYLLPLFYTRVFGNEASTYAYLYVYAAVALENVAFAYGYLRARNQVVQLPFLCAQDNFGRLALLFLSLATVAYFPVLLQFHEFLLDPREIYRQTRTGFGTEFFISSTLAFVSVIVTLFARRSWPQKAALILVATLLIAAHGSKGQILAVILIVGLYLVYAGAKKFSLTQTLVVCLALSVVLALLFAATMALGDGLQDILESVSQYSDYTRNAMLVIDSRFPFQYGRITLEANIYGLIPRALMPNKPKDFGPFALADYFYPEAFDADKGAPAFGVGVQYADLGPLAIVYIALMAALRGWLARIFVNRLSLTRHPADFFMVAFLADVPLFPVGVGWFLPEALVVALVIRYLSTIGSRQLYRERAWSRRRGVFFPEAPGPASPQSI
jgi:hypothetical protein